MKLLMFYKVVKCSESEVELMLFFLLTFEACKIMIYVCTVSFFVHSANISWFFNVTEK